MRGRYSTYRVTLTRVRQSCVSKDLRRQEQTEMPNLVISQQYRLQCIRLGFISARCVAAGFAFWATARHPYRFYILSRWAVFLTCCWGIYLFRRRLWPSTALVYFAIGLVFNPLSPLIFARSTWHNLDVIAAVILLATLAFSRPDPASQ
jgi:hypothetical protein